MNKMKFRKGGCVLIRKERDVYILEKYWFIKPKNRYFLSSIPLTKNKIFIDLDKDYSWIQLINKAKSL